MQKNKQSRKKLTLAAIALVVVFAVYAFWPKPTLVDMGTVSQGHMVVTINEEARTRVHDIYTISAPVSGRLLRVEVEPNDPVEKSKTIVAHMLPANPGTLNSRELAQALTTVESAEASLSVAQANLKKAHAHTAFTKVNLTRASQTKEKGTISQAEFDKTQWEAESAEAELENAKAAISLRKAALSNAKAALINMDSLNLSTPKTIDLKSPINGRVLTILQKSEVIIGEGTAIVEVGNVAEDLEVIVELLSTDAVKINKGNKVMIQNWGETEPLSGVVARIDPAGFTKYSALGIEEQRVNAIIQLTDSNENALKLGHGFRVEVQIVIWENDNALIVPASALFRKNNQWAVFVVDNDKAKLQRVNIERNNGIQASVIEGLTVDERVVLYPASTLEDGMHIVDRNEKN